MCARSNRAVFRIALGLGQIVIGAGDRLMATGKYTIAVVRVEVQTLQRCEPLGFGALWRPEQRILGRVGAERRCALAMIVVVLMRRCQRIDRRLVGDRTDGLV